MTSPVPPQLSLGFPTPGPLFFCALRSLSKYTITTLCRQYNCFCIKYRPIAQITTPQCYSKVTLIEPCGPVILLWSRGMSLWRSLLCDRHSAHSAHSDPTVLLMPSAIPVSSSNVCTPPPSLSVSSSASPSLPSPTSSTSPLHGSSHRPSQRRNHHDLVRRSFARVLLHGMSLCHLVHRLLHYPASHGSVLALDLAVGN